MCGYEKTKNCPFPSDFVQMIMDFRFWPVKIHKHFICFLVMVIESFFFFLLDNFSIMASSLFLFNLSFLLILIIYQLFSLTDSLSMVMNKHLCDIYKNNINFVQLTSTSEELAIFPLCVDNNNNNNNHTVTTIIRSPYQNEKIIAYDFHLRKNDIWFITDQHRLYRMKINNTNVNYPIRLEGEYRWFTITQLAIDWIHDLLYMVADQSDIILTSIANEQSSSSLSVSMNRPTSLLFSSYRRTIKKLLICSGLSTLVWHEIDWSDSNENRLQIARQDGTEMAIIFTSPTFIYDVQIDQANYIVYFVTNGQLGEISLQPPEEYQDPDAIRKHTRMFRLQNNYVKTFNIICK